VLALGGGGVVQPALRLSAKNAARVAIFFIVSRSPAMVSSFRDKD
jgi:hypothetical protein